MNSKVSAQAKMIDILENPDKYSKTPVFAGQKVHYQQDQYSKKNRLSPSKKTGHTHMWYKKDEKPPAPTVINKTAPAAAPKPAEKKIEAGTFKVSPEIQQAKERVSAWEQAQATVQSSFIKPSTSSDSNLQYDFASNSFNANQSSDPNVRNQTAQSAPEDYMSKYSRYKSSN